MREDELNAAISVIPDPVSNVYRLDSRKAVEEYNKICAGLESYGRAIIKEHPINFQDPSSLTAARQEAYDITRSLKQGG